MKKNLLLLFSAVLAIAAFSFTVRKTTDVYFVYNSGAQKDITHYTIPGTPPVNPSGTAFLAWIRIRDADGTVTSTEFNTAFDALDTVTPNADNLDDDNEKVLNSGTSTEIELAKTN